MADSWRDNSEMVGGLVITGRISSNTVRPELFYPPIDEVIKLYKSGTVGVEELSEMCGFSVVSTLLEAASSVNGTLNKLDWIKKLEISYSKYSNGDELEKLGKRLKKGEDIDLSKLTTIAAKTSKAETSLTPASKVVPKEVPFIKCGYKPIDDHLGGIAMVGITLIGAYFKVGKTSLAIRIQKDFLKEYPNKRVAFFSLEMLNEEIRMRGDEIDEWTEDELGRWILCDEMLTSEQIINKSASIDVLAAIVVSLLLSGQSILS